MPAIIRKILTKRIKGFSTLETLIAFSIFGVLMMTIMSLFRNELKDMGFAKNEAGLQIAFLRIENRLKGLVLPEKDIDESTIWASQSLQDKVRLSSDGKNLVVGQTEVFYKNGKLLQMSQGREKALFSSSETVQLKSVDFRLDNNLLESRVSVAQDEKSEMRTFHFLLANR